ncbi:MAG: hypothetical protein Q9M45_03725 [Robiginitomaculum sp.]|nr:hypothetical protein [Robiginitomaculum sp.]
MDSFGRMYLVVLQWIIVIHIWRNLPKFLAVRYFFSDKGVGFVTIKGKAPRIEAVMDKFDDWFEVIKAYQETFRDKE